MTLIPAGLSRREFANYQWATFPKDLLAGLTVAAVGLPLALAFGVASGTTAAAGVVTAVLSGPLIGGLGGSPYQISGPTGAMSAVLIILAARDRADGGDVFLSGAQPAVGRILDRAGLSATLGEDHFFWSADTAIVAAESRQQGEACPYCDRHGGACARGTPATEMAPQVNVTRADAS